MDPTLPSLTNRAFFFLAGLLLGCVEALAIMYVAQLEASRQAWMRPALVAGALLGLLGAAVVAYPGGDPYATWRWGGTAVLGSAVALGLVAARAQWLRLDGWARHAPDWEPDPEDPDGL